MIYQLIAQFTLEIKNFLTQVVENMSVHLTLNRFLKCYALIVMLDKLIGDVNKKHKYYTLECIFTVSYCYKNDVHLQLN